MIRIAISIAALIALVGAGGASAASLQQVGAYDDPMYVTSDPTNPDRLFVAERAGRIVESVAGQTAVFADITDRVGTGGEGGLLSLALAPDFASSGRLFVDYTDAAGQIVVAELRAGGGNALGSTPRELLSIPHPGETNHYGGQLQFGPEGLLYVSTGDGGGENDEHVNAQDPKRLLGKILRLDPQPSGLLGYTVPPGNPFAGGEPADDLVWSLGLRNPYRFSFDRETGAMLIGDVGQAGSEEVDYAPPGGGAGVNYGWACREGFDPGPRAAEPECAVPASSFVDPLFTYPRGGSCAAIVGGYVVRDRSLGDLYGRYLYGDYCREGLRSFAIASPFATDRAEGIGVSLLTSFGEDSCSRLYVVAGNGRVFRIEGDGDTACAAAAKPKKVSYVGVRAQGRRVIKRKRAQITAWVSPCDGRRGEPVKLWRGRKHLATRRLDRACSVRFRPRITRRANFRATVAEDANYIAATSRKLRIKVDHRKPSRRDGKQR